MSIISYDKIYEGLRISHDAKMEKALKKRKLRTLMTVIDSKNNSGQSSKGWRRLKTLRKALDSFKPFERTRMQKRFHHAFMQATAMHIFKDDTDLDLARVMSINGWKHLKQQCLAMTPRRFGKTMSVGMFVAAYLYSVENAEICIFSTGRRASQKLLELIKSLIEKLPDGRDRIMKFNQEILNLSNFDGSPGSSKLSSFPSNAKTLRGVGGDIVIMEEVSSQPSLFSRPLGRTPYSTFILYIEQRTVSICLLSYQSLWNLWQPPRLTKLYLSLNSTRKNCRRETLNL
jgi:hypothetical protein